MAPRGSAWLLLLLLQVALLLEAAEAQGPSQFRMKPQEAVARPGSKVTLSCEVMVSNVPQGCSWLFQPRHKAKSPTFLLYHSPTRTQVGSGLDPKRYGSSKSGNVYSLTVNGFGPQDEGYYYCAFSGNYMLYFGPFVPVFLPAPPTTTPPPPPPTTPTPRVQPTSARPQTCVVAKGAAGASWLDLSCDVYIWAPLACTCAALLLALVITIICYRRNRRRVCKCPRPQVRSGGKPSPSGKLI